MSEAFAGEDFDYVYFHIVLAKPLSPCMFIIINNLLQQIASDRNTSLAVINKMEIM